MNDPKIDRTLEEIGYGTLALTRDDAAYGVPVSFGYDGDRLFLFLFQFGDESQKLEYREQTRQATLTVIDIGSRFEWRSVIVDKSPIAVAEDTSLVCRTCIPIWSMVDTTVAVPAEHTCPIQFERWTCFIEV